MSATTSTKGTPGPPPGNPPSTSTPAKSSGTSTLSSPQAAGTKTPSKSTTSNQPPNPKMGTSEETYPGSQTWYLAFGGKPKADWSGIKDLSARPMTDLCFRSLDPVAGQKSMLQRIKGLETKFDVKDNINEFQLKVWDHLVKYGLDTIGYLPDPRDPRNKVLCVVTKHAQLTGDMEMVEKLSNYISKRFDRWDIKNDSEAKTFLLESLSEDLEKGFRPFYKKEKDSFAVLWLKLIHYLVTTSSRTFDNLKEEIRKIKPQQYGGQDIEKMSKDYMDKCEQLVNAGYFDVSLILNMVDGFLCASPDSKGTFHHSMNTIRVKVESLERLTVFMSKEDQMDRYAQEKSDYKSICYEAVKAYKALCELNLWEPKKLPKDRQTSPSIQLAALSRQVNTIVANMQNGRPQQKQERQNRPDNSLGEVKGGNESNNKSIKCFNCGEPNHLQKDCPYPRKSLKERRIIRHKNSAPWRLKPPRKGEGISKIHKGVKYYWCGKCGNWTTSHSTETHTSTKNFGKGNKKKGGFTPQTNLTSFEPEIWLTHFDDEEEDDLEDNFENIFTVKTVLKYLYFVATLALLLGLPVPTFATVLETFQDTDDIWVTVSSVLVTYASTIWTWLKVTQYIVGPMIWLALGYFATKIPKMFKTKFNPVLITPQPRKKRRRSQSRSNSPRYKLKSARDYGLSPKYPIRLRNDQQFNTRSRTPTHKEREIQADLNRWIQDSSPENPDFPDNRTSHRQFTIKNELPTPKNIGLDI